MGVIINLCPTGMVPSKENNPHVPITPKEIIHDVLPCIEAGARVVHLHARDPGTGQPTWKKEIFAQIIGGIRERTTDALLTVTTSGRNWEDYERRSEVLELKGDLKPDLASLTLGSMNFIGSASVNSPEMIQRLASKMLDNGISPELEVFEPGMINTAKYLSKKGFWSNQAHYFNILLGNLGTSPFNANALSTFINELWEGCVWSVAGIGRYQTDANVAALALGGNVRVGLEDNLYWDRQQSVEARNLALVQRITAICDLMQLTIATPAETAKKILGR